MTPALTAVGRALAGSPVLLLIAALVALGSVEVFFISLRRLGRRWTDRSIALAIVRRCWWPGRFLTTVIACELVLPYVHMPASAFDLVQHLLNLALVAASSWTIVALTFALEDATFARYRIDVENNLRARRLRTRVSVFRRVTVVVATMLAIAAMLTTFQGVRDLGTTLLASAGIASVVIGIAARPMIANVIAGIQIFFAEPMRIDDVVIVEGQWGRVEEITLNYVVVRTWDERSIVLPLQYFLEHPFENWTRHSAYLIGAVYVAADFTVPVQTVREELYSILQASDLWDRRMWNLQVTEISRDSVELRALMSARDASTTWDLRCEVREKLLKFLQARMPSGLPRWRVDLVKDGGGVGLPGEEALRHGN